MNLHEDAAISYQPDDEETGTGGIQAALAEAERQLTPHRGFQGIGVTQTPSGKDAIIVYVEDQQALERLPEAIGGFPVVGEITGEIRAL